MSDHRRFVKEACFAEAEDTETARAGNEVFEEMAQSPSVEKRYTDMDCPERRLGQRISQRTSHGQCRPCVFKTLKVCADPVATQAIGRTSQDKSKLRIMLHPFLPQHKMLLD